MRDLSASPKVSSASHLPFAPRLVHIREQQKVVATQVENVDNIIVLKLGTSSMLCEDFAKPAFSLSNFGKLVDMIVMLKVKGYQVVLISSGAVGAGALHLKLKDRPKHTNGKRAVSAVGQCLLMRLYEDLFAIRESKVAQLLITRTDLCRKCSFINFKNTMFELLSMDVIPIINENDSLASPELNFGDNDTLAAYVAIALRAKWLILLTDVDCLYTANPRHDSDAKPIIYCDELDEVYRIVESGVDTMGSNWGSGGMRTKIIASKVSTATGIPTALCHGKHPERILDMVRTFEPENSFKETLSDKQNEKGLVILNDFENSPYIGTVFAAQECLQSVQDQRRWIYVLPVHGKLYIDDGAIQAVMDQKSSLFASGIVALEGEFFEGEVVALYSSSASNVTRSDLAGGTLSFDGISSEEADAPELARCIVNFSSDEIERIKGMKSEDFKTVLGHPVGQPEVAHRSNISFIRCKV